LTRAEWTTTAGVVVRALLASAAAFWLMQRFAEQIVRWLEPAIPATLEWIARDFHIISVGQLTEGGSARVAIVAILSRSLVEAGQAVIAGDTANIILTTTVGSVLQPLWLAFIVVAAWPGRAAEIALRFPLVLPMAAVAFLLDTPTGFAARLWDTQLRALQIPHDSPLIWWNTFLNGGGRLVLGMVAGAGAVAAARSLTSTFMPRVDK
jgi:hypothetical protein